jgi:uncharacterized membrane protein YhfC
MSFFISCAVSGGILAILPLALSRYLRKIWQTPKWLMLKASMAMFCVEFFHVVVVMNVTTGWQDYNYLPPLSQSLLAGLAAGLFYELGRYMFLDRFFRKVRSWREGIFFGIGWTAISTTIVGMTFFFLSFSADAIVNSTDLAVTFPNASSVELEQIQVVRNQFIELSRQNPNFGLTIVFERIAIMMADIVLTLLILLTFRKGSTKYVWLAVISRILFTASVVYVSSLNSIAGTMLYPAYAVLAFFVIRTLKDYLTEGSSMPDNSPTS